MVFNNFNTCSNFFGHDVVSLFDSHFLAACQFHFWLFKLVFGSAIFHRCVAIQLIKELKFADDVCLCSNIDLNTPKEIWRNFMFDVR